MFRSSKILGSKHLAIKIWLRDLVNAQQLREELFQEDRRHINTNSDSEVLLNIFAHALQNKKRVELTKHDIFNAVDEVHKRVEGAYSVIIMISGYGMVAFRDPNGIRPLIFGSKGKNKYMFSSESVASISLIRFCKCWLKSNAIRSFCISNLCLCSLWSSASICCFSFSLCSWIRTSC